MDLKILNWVLIDLYSIARAQVLTSAVRREARKKRLCRIYDEKEELGSRLKQIGLRPEERLVLEKKMEEIETRIRQIMR